MIQLLILIIAAYTSTRLLEIASTGANAGFVRAVAVLALIATGLCVWAVLTMAQAPPTSMQ